MRDSTDRSVTEAPVIPRYRLEPFPVNIETVAARAAEQNNVCVMCGSADQAETVYKTWQNAGLDGIFLITARLAARQRSIAVSMIRKLQRIGAPVHVAATPCIESGVDLDFEWFWHAIAPVPNLVQASGRHNRHGRYMPRPMTVFVPSDMAPDGTEKADIEAALDRLGLDAGAPATLDAIESYGRWLVSLTTDEKKEE